MSEENKRKFIINYKGVNIECWRGSNFVYINNRPFMSLLSAKRWVSKRGEVKK